MEELEGKTIQSVSPGEIRFTDGSSLEFWINNTYPEYSQGRIIIGFRDGGNYTEIEF